MTCRHHEPDESCADCMGELVPLRSPRALRWIEEIRSKYLREGDDG